VRGRPKGKFTQHRRLDKLCELLERHPKGLSLYDPAGALNVTVRSMRRYEREADLESVPTRGGAALLWRRRPSEIPRKGELRRTQTYALLAARRLFEPMRGSALVDEIDHAVMKLLALAQRPGRGPNAGLADVRPEERFRYLPHAPKNRAERTEELDDLFQAVSDLRPLSLLYKSAVRLTMTIGNLTKVVSWVLEWDARVKVIEPPELIERVRAELAGALAQYPASPKAEAKKKSRGGMKRIAWLGVGLACILVCVAPPARAETPQVSLRWNAPDECPDDAQVLSEVERLLGAPLAHAPAQQLAVNVTTVGGLGGFSAKLTFKSPAGVAERYLEHADCQMLMSGAALLIALAIDPERMKARDPEQPAAAAAARVPAAGEAPEATPMSTAPAAMDAETTRREARDEPGSASRQPMLGKPLQLLVSGFGFVSVGTLPSVGPGVGLELGLRREHFQASLLGRYGLPRAVAVPGSLNAEIELSMGSLGLRGCGLPWLGDLRFELCAGADIGRLSGTGHGLDHSRTRHARFSQLSAGLRAAYGAQAVAPLVGVEGAWALERPPFGVTVEETPIQIFRPAFASFSAQIGLTYAF
jgi:hypothetical protein